MKPSPFLLPTFLILAIVGWHAASAFQTTTSTRSSPLVARRQLLPVFALLSPATIQEQHQQRRSSNTLLRYRELDQEDADTDAMLKVQTRAPPGFDMKKNLKQQRRTAMNVPLIRAILLNQGLILGLATIASAVLLFFTNGVDAFSHLGDIFLWSGDVVDFDVTPLRLLTGLAAAAPVVFFGNLVERSDDRALANINFSTITMVMTLFGRRTSPPDAFLPKQFKGRTIPTTSTADVLLQSSILATITGICEEIVFRMEIPGLLNHYNMGGFPLLPLVGQAALFALGHYQASTGLRENGIVVGLQFINGSWFGLVYLLTGGDLIACIVAHATYDFFVFFKTWLDANEQVEYAESMWLEPLPQDVQKQVLATSGELNPKTFNAVKRLFYTFDFDKNKTLSKSEVRKGFSYLALERAGTPPPQAQVDALFDRYTSDVVEKSRLTLPDFLQLYTKSVLGKKPNKATRRG
mmetsp:Transcript_8784/g.14595  ORF Transcript_8784/g.14595 Transcript_8784/m.14595 type:complete len:465 (-) Transcript_8784:179-1573(-)|eukprot:CAMPEP_0119013802 /NCGR_PEP_ID=MMETSP1176-20130426/8990_1 /TAXON_ID=265551 /ORGANISM="Synedropsis recta cf, Strain CCMP1620" /LENGTH=464 /DNA_ID=CAMNT_0006966921 /DNA_START=88 /DNA_END=1482 /DNA_ORIENTATION=-